MKRVTTKVTDSFYRTPKWRAWRDAIILRRGRVCQQCGADLSWPQKAHVDHVKSRKQYPELAFDPSNVRVLCTSCHSSKTAREDGGFGNKVPTGCSVDGIPLDASHHWVRPSRSRNRNG